jgi:2'-hydroxyisoflavone reductase
MVGMQPQQYDRRHEDDEDDGPGLAQGQLRRRRQRRAEHPSGDADRPLPAGYDRRLLVLGGTRFLGRAVAAAALAAGWHVTCFNRGITGPDLAGVEAVRGDRTEPADLERLADHGRWDTVVDTSSHLPDAAPRILHPVAGRYALVSGVAAYRDWPAGPVDESAPLWAAGPEPEGPRRVACEQAVRDVYGDSALILRPGVLLGPREPAGTLPALLHAVAQGEPVGIHDRPIQPVDVRDAADFIVDLAGAAGVYNVVAPPWHGTYRDLVDACLDVTGARETPGGTDPWPADAGFWQVDGARARAAGLRCRPLAATVADTWEWTSARVPAG